MKLLDAMLLPEMLGAMMNGAFALWGVLLAAMLLWIRSKVPPSGV